MRADDRLFVPDLLRDDALLAFVLVFDLEVVFAFALVFVFVFARELVFRELVFARELVFRELVFVFVFVFARVPVFRELVFDLAREPVLEAVFFFAVVFRFAALFVFARDVFVFARDVFVFVRPAPVLRVRVDRRAEPEPSPVSSSSSPPPPNSLFATTAAAGTARPIAVPATTFFGVDRPSCSSSVAMLSPFVISPR